MTPRLTQRDLEDTPDDGNRYEVIDGALYVSPFANYAHQRATSCLFCALFNHVALHKLGEVLGPGLKVVLDEPTGVGPDLTFVSTARMGAMQADGFYGAPDLVVEVLSTKPQLDRFVKFNKYASAGVSFYWIVDPERRALDAYRLEGGRYALEGSASGEAEFRPGLFPGLAIELRDLWA